ncbi:MAG: tRNA (adenosine(37)-N6)-threonylcarbamoyltransferase complex ATPase subunit type 1 TsaE [Candidatus Binatia bacterium]
MRSPSSGQAPGGPDQDDAAEGGTELTVHSSGEDETRMLGVRLGRRMQGGELIGLRGELGVGKTVFSRGLADGLGIPAGKVHSPTFTLINEYSGGRLPLYHVDLYRLHPSDVDRLALREYLYGRGVCVVEWFEHLGEVPPCLVVDFTFVGANTRLLVVSARGPGYHALVEELRNG